MSRNRFMSSSNPFLSNIAERSGSSSTRNITTADDTRMTVQGAVNKTLLLTMILLVSAIAFGKILPYSPVVFYGSMFGAIAVAMFTYSKPTVAQYTAPLYAVLKGILVGSISYAYGAMLGPGIVFNALLLTILCLVSMLVLYKTGIIKPTQKFRSMVTTATGALMMIYLVSMGLRIFNIQLPFLHQTGAVGIGISFFIVGLASFNLILDFDNIESGARVGAPKYMEWACSMGLLATLVWLYIELLQLLAMLASND